VAIVHGKATPAVLSDPSYWRAFGRANPDSNLIRELAEHGVNICVCGQAFLTSRGLRTRCRFPGVNICVCGQAFLNQGFRKHDLNQDVTLALSVRTVLPIYHLKGYALMTYEERA
jgi:intracellular sulfur oxidation DsrE/DsrF family protein